MWGVKSYSAVMKYQQGPAEGQYPKVDDFVVLLYYINIEQLSCLVLLQLTRHECKTRTI